MRDLRTIAEAARGQVESGNEWDRQNGDSLSRLEAVCEPDLILAALDVIEAAQAAMSAVTTPVAIRAEVALRKALARWDALNG